MKKILSLLLIGAIFLSGCGNGDAEEIETEVTTEITEPELTPFPVEINEVTFTKAPEKIVCLSPSLTEILYEMGYGDKIIGRSSYCDYPEEVLEAEELGNSTYPDIERIIQLAPDVVVTSSEISSKDIFTMQQAGIKTLTIMLPKTIDDFSSIYVGFGLMEEGLFTGEEKGEQAFSPISSSLNNTEALSLGSFVYITEDFNIATGDTFESAVFSCFGTNIANDATDYDFDTKTLLENQPDYILLNNIYEYEDLVAHEVFSQLNAIMNGKVILIDNRVLERPSAKICDMVKDFTEQFKSIEANG